MLKYEVPSLECANDLELDVLLVCPQVVVPRPAPFASRLLVWNLQSSSEERGLCSPFAACSSLSWGCCVHWSVELVTRSGKMLESTGGHAV